MLGFIAGCLYGRTHPLIPIHVLFEYVKTNIFFLWPPTGRTNFLLTAPLLLCMPPLAVNQSECKRCQMWRDVSGLRDIAWSSWQIVQFQRGKQISGAIFILFRKLPCSVCWEALGYPCARDSFARAFALTDDCPP